MAQGLFACPFLCERFQSILVRSFDPVRAGDLLKVCGAAGRTTKRRWQRQWAKESLDGSCVVFGIITAIAGAMAYFGGATLSAVLKLLGFGIGMTALGWNMRRRP